jgi:hypothetical protein
MAEILDNKIKYSVDLGNTISAHQKAIKSNKLLFKSLKEVSDDEKKSGISKKKLVEVNKKLVEANKKLVEENRKLSKSYKILDKDQNIAYRNNRNLLGSFSVLRSKLLLATFAVGMLSRTLGKYVNSAADVEEITNKFNVVFGESSESAHQFARTLSSSVGRARSSLLEMLSSLQDTFVPLGFARDASADLSKVLTKLSIDVASFNNAADDDVMRAFQSAIVGNHEAVRSFGIVLTEAEIKSHALSKGIIDTNRELTSQEKVLARVSLIFNSTKDAHGDALKTQESYANSVKRLSANLKTLSEMMGDTLMPIARDLVSALSSLAGVFTDTARIKGYALSLFLLASGFTAVKIATAAATIGFRAFEMAFISTGIGILVIAFAELAARTFLARDEIEDLTSSTITFEEAMENLKASIRETGSAIDDMNYSELNKKLVATETSYKNLSPFIEGASDRTKKHILNLELLIKALKEAIDPTEKVISGFKTKIAILKAGNEVEKESIRIAAQLGVEVENLDPTVRQLIEDYIKEKEAVDAANKSSKEAIKLKKEEKREAERLMAVMKKTREDFYKSLDEMRMSDFEQGVKDLDDKIKLFQDAKISEVEIQEFVNARMAELSQEEIDNERKKFEERNILYNSFLAGYDEFINTMIDKDLSAEERKQRILLATRDFFVRMLGEMIKEKIKQLILEAVIDKAAKAEQLATVKAMSVAVAEYWATGALLSAVATGSASVAAALVSIRAGVATSKALAIKEAEHGYDGVVNRPTLFLTGEKNKPEHVKVTPLSGGSTQERDARGASVNINISGGLIQDDYIRNELIPALNKAVSLGAELNA